MNDDAAARFQVRPWVPISNPLHLKILGKLAEELGEATAAVARCIIQGICEQEPNTGKVNREWLEDEIADVKANLDLAVAAFDLDPARIERRAERKRQGQREWHKMLPVAAKADIGVVRAPSADYSACRPAERSHE